MVANSRSHLSITAWVTAAALAVAVFVAYLLTHRGPTLAFAILILPALGWLVFERAAGTMVGVALILTVPYWETLGIAHTNMLRVASVIAAAGILARRHRTQMNIVDATVAAFFAAVALGWLLQYDHPRVGLLVVGQLTPLGFYFGARALPIARRPTLMRAALAAGSVGALTVLYELVHGSPVFIDPASYYWNASAQTIFRPGGIFGGPPGAATVLAFVIFFGLGVLPGLRGRGRKLAISGVCVCSIALISTFTRANLIGVAIGLIVYLWAIRSPLLRPAPVTFFVLVAAVGAAILLPLLGQSSVFQQGIVRPGTFAQRESYWTAALPISTSSVHNLVFGLGTGTLEVPSVARGDPIPAAEAATPQVYRISLHNEYVSTLFEQGLIGLSALILLLVAVLFTLVRHARATRDPISAGVAASVVALAVDMAANTALLHGPTMSMLMLAAGLAAGLAGSHCRLSAARSCQDPRYNERALAVSSSMAANERGSLG